MCFGVGIGFILHPYLNQRQYNLGLVSFCNLSEADRFKVCPSARYSIDLDEGGNLTLYVCDNNHAFVETNNIPKDSVFVKNLLKSYKNRNKQTVSQCKTKYGIIYELVGK